MEYDAKLPEIIRNLRADPENLYCFDCSNIDITYFSVDLGILLCSGCAAAHKTLIPEISEVKSLTGPFTARDLKYLNAGGNASLKTFFAMYSIPCNDSIEYKYRTLACKYYKEMIKCMVTGSPCTMLTPSESEGLEVNSDPHPIEMFSYLKKYSSVEVEPEKLEDTESSPETEKPGFFRRIKESKSFKSIGNFTDDVIAKAKNTAKEGINYFLSKKVSRDDNFEMGSPYAKKLDN